MWPTLLEWAAELAAAVLAALLLRTFVFQFVRVDGRSMQDTLQHNDILFATVFDRFFRDAFHYGDIVICRYPGVKGYRVKRIVGMTGDTLELHDGVLYRGGIPVPESYVAQAHISRREYGPVTVPDGCFFLMGDNRAISRDSRSPQVGPIARNAIIGKVRFRLFPFNRMGTVRSTAEGEELP